MNFQNFSFDRLIIHEINKRKDDRSLAQPQYGTQLLTLAFDAREALIERIQSAMGAFSRSTEMSIKDISENSIFQIARILISSEPEEFILASKKVADKLAEAQKTRTIPGGVLLILSGGVGFPQKRMLSIIKAELHTGFKRSLINNIVTIDYIKELFLTPEAKLYKIGIFIEDEPDTEIPEPAGWKVFVYDSLIGTANKLNAAQYFYDAFLGCDFPDDSARKTKDFYVQTKAFIHNMDISEEEKYDLYNGLVTYLKVDKTPVVDVCNFAQSYFSDPQTQQGYISLMENKNIPTICFSKDIEQLKTVLRFRKVIFSHDIKLTAPAENFKEMVTLEEFESDQLNAEGGKVLWTAVTIKGTIKHQD